MKNLYLQSLIVLLTLSCKQEKGRNFEITAEEVRVEEVTDDDFESSDIEAFEKELEEVAIGGEGIRFENGQMTFDIESLESSAKEVEAQLKNIKENIIYDTEGGRQSAIISMELNLDLFRGEFCCTTHNGEHCEDSKKLKILEEKYNCQHFKKND